jgi:hypothetical protein
MGIEEYQNYYQYIKTTKKNNQLKTKLLMAIKSIYGLDEDEGKTPCLEAFKEAETFIDLLPENIYLPSIWASGDAEVGLTWRYKRNFMEVAFSGDRILRYGVAFPLKDSTSWKGGEIKIDIVKERVIPNLLLNFLDKLKQ